MVIILREENKNGPWLGLVHVVTVHSTNNQWLKLHC